MNTLECLFGGRWTLFLDDWVAGKCQHVVTLSLVAAHCSERYKTKNQNNTIQYNTTSGKDTQTSREMHFRLGSTCIYTQTHAHVHGHTTQSHSPHTQALPRASWTQVHVLCTNMCTQTSPWCIANTEQLTGQASWWGRAAGGLDMRAPQGKGEDAFGRDSDTTNVTTLPAL